MFTQNQLKQFEAYERVRKSGQHNMLTPMAARACGLGRDEMVFCMKNYDALTAVAADCERNADTTRLLNEGVM